jgi:hypothetical protein
MTLDNLIGKLLERIEPDQIAVQRLLDAAERNIVDAAVAECILQAKQLLALTKAWLTNQ